MASGLAAALPLTVDDVDGPYRLIQNHVDLVKQNFKMLILTNPGERMMNPDFGVGLQRYLFEQAGGNLHNEINDRILGQTRKYMNYIEINQIDFGVPASSPELYPHSLSIRIEFTIIPLQTSTSLEIEFKN